MAREETWAKLRHFKKDSSLDQWGDVNAIDDFVLLRLDDFRHYIDVPCYVTSGVRPETDGRSSYHTRGKGACAVDVMFPEYKGHPIDLIFMSMRFGFTGIGYYPDWEWKGIKCGGLHLDTRPLGLDADGTINYGHSMWMGIKVAVKKADGSIGFEQKYIELSYKNLIRSLGRE